MAVSGQLHFRTSRSFTGERTRGAHWEKLWAGPRAEADGVEMSNVSSFPVNRKTATLLLLLSERFK
jgi:hypothetical protein